MGALIAGVIQWAIVPLIILAMLGWSWIIAGSASESELRTSAWAGFWAGLVLFVIYVVSQLNTIRNPTIDFSGTLDVSLIPVVFGLVLGFGFLWMVRFMIPTRMVGIITLLLSALSTSALFSYVFIDALRAVVLNLTLGGALGILLHIIFFPSSLKDLRG